MEFLNLLLSIFLFRRCHFIKHDGMLRELFYCLWRGSNMSVVCTEDEIIFIYLNVLCETWQKNSCIVTKNFISAHNLISKIFRYNRYINKTHEKINILNCYFIASNVLLRILRFYSEEMCEM